MNFNIPIKIDSICNFSTARLLIPCVLLNGLDRNNKKTRNFIFKTSTNKRCLI